MHSGTLPFVSTAVKLKRITNNRKLQIILEYRGRSLDFALKTCEGLRVFGCAIWKELQRDKTMEAGILSLVHHTHPTPTEPFEDAVMRNGLADGRVSGRHSGAILGF